MGKIQIDPRLKEVYCIIGSNINRLRGQMSQEKLAKKAGVSKTTIWSIEKGRAISLEKLVKIADALGIDPGNLFLSDQDKVEVTYKFKLIVEKLVDLLGVEEKK